MSPSLASPSATVAECCDHLSAEAFAALVRGLGHDARLGARVGACWRFDTVARVVEADRTTLDSDRELALGLIVHEIGHALVSRYTLLRPPLDSPAAAAHLCNAVEDPRANLFMKRRYPGTARWLARVDAHAREGCRPPAARLPAFMLAASVADAYDWQGPPPWLQGPPEAVAAFHATQRARHHLARMLPPHDLVWPSGNRPVGVALAREFVPQRRAETDRPPGDQVAGGVGGGGGGDDEAVVRVFAARAHAILAHEIAPIARRLLDADRASLATYLASQPDHGRELPRALQRAPDLAAEMLDEAFRTPPGEASGRDQERARALYERYLEGQLPLGAGRASAPSGRHRGTMRLPPAPHPRARALDHQAVAAAVAGQVPGLVAAVAAVLRPRPSRPAAGFASGQGIDLRRAMAFAADRRGYDRLWQRARRPGRPEAAVSLVIDLSGSMSGGKIEAAVLGTLVLAEAFARLAPAVRFAVDGFQDRLIPFKGFQEPLTEAVRAAILAMPEETVGSRPDGHNTPRWNDDGPCLLAAAAQLRLQPTAERILFMVSDGLPAGRHSTAADLRLAVAQLAAPGAGLVLFGLGLGDDTEHVRDFYPNAIANTPPDELVTRIGGLLRRVLDTPRMP